MIKVDDYDSKSYKLILIYLLICHEKQYIMNYNHEMTKSYH